MLLGGLHGLGTETCGPQVIAASGGLLTLAHAESGLVGQSQT